MKTTEQTAGVLRDLLEQGEASLNMENPTTDRMTTANTTAITADIQAVPMEVFISACTMCGTGCLLATIFAIFNFRNRNARIVRMSSPNINMLLLCGAYLAYFCCVLTSLGALQHVWNAHIAACQVLTWLLPLAFTLTFGAMFTKSWRVRRIFLQAPHKKVVVKDNILFAIVLGFLVLDFLLLASWQAIDPIQVTLLTEKITYHTGNDMEALTMTSSPMTMTSMRSCVSQYSSMWMSAMFVYKTLVLLYGVYLSWTVRAVTLPAMNDTTAIILSSLLTAFISMTTAVMTVWFRFHPEVTSSIMMAAIWVCTTVTLCLNFIPKMCLVVQNSEEELIKVTMASQVIYSPNQSIDQVEDEIYHLVAENRGLKKALGQKEQRIKALQEHVTNAKEKLESLIIEDKQDSGLDADMSSSSNHDEEPPPSSSSVRHDSLDSGQPDDHSKHFGLYVRRNNHKHGGSGRASSISSSRYSSRQMSGSRASLRSLSQAWFRFPRRRPNSVAGSSSLGGTAPGSAVAMSLDHYQRSRLRDSLGDLAHELHTVDYLSSALCHAFHKDLVQTRSRSSVYEHVRAKQDIAGSIVDSYDLDDMSDTYSYVSNHISNTNYLQPMRYQRGNIHNGCEDVEQSETMQRAPSIESVSTIGNDRYYPSQPQGRFTKKGRHSRRLGQRGGWKREPKPKIFTVFGPKAIKQPPLAQAGVKILYDEGTYV